MAGDGAAGRSGSRMPPACAHMQEEAAVSSRTVSRGPAAPRWAGANLCQWCDTGACQRAARSVNTVCVQSLPGKCSWNANCDCFETLTIFSCSREFDDENHHRCSFARNSQGIPKKETCSCGQSQDRGIGIPGFREHEKQPPISSRYTAVKRYSTVSWYVYADVVLPYECPDIQGYPT